MAAYGLSTTFKRRKYIKYSGLGESVLPKDPVSKGLNMLKDNQTALYGLGAGVVDVIDQGNEYGVQSNVGSFAKGALSGAAMGSTLGPIGTGVGALVGGGISLMQNKKRASEQREMEQQSAIRNKRLKDNFYAAKLQANPELVQGNQNGQYFEMGGELTPPTLAEISKMKPKAKEKYEPKAGVKNLKAALASANLATMPFVNNPLGLLANRAIGVASSVGDAYTSVRYLMDGQKGKASIDAAEALADLIPYKKGVVVGKGVFNLSKTLPSIKKATSNVNKVGQTLRGAGIVDDLSDVELDKKQEGGPLSDHYLLHKKTYGGNVVPKSSDGVEFQGNSHDEGGIKIPELGVEVEGNETAKDNYVFSDKLGFAKLHKPILRAKGKIEAKAPTPERINAINLLNEREKRLMNLQEMFKKKMNINQQ